MAVTKVRLNERTRGLRNIENVVTGETFAIEAPIVLYDEFIGKAISQYDWNLLTRETAGTPVVALSSQSPLSSGAYGAALMQLDSDSEAEEAALDWNDILAFDPVIGPIMEVRCKIGQDETSAHTDFFIGFGGAQETDKDDLLRIGFRNTTTTAILAQTYDGVSNENAVISADTGTTVGTWHVLRLDASDLDDVRFYVDGVRVCADTTFLWADETTGMQPILSVSKDTSAEVGSLLVDYVKIWASR